jgi:hypothetical protein
MKPLQLVILSENQIKQETNVVSVKVDYIRPKYDNLAEWMMDPNNIYIGRRGIVFVPTTDGNKIRYPPNDSIWANPYKISNQLNRDQCLMLYRNHIVQSLKSGQISLIELGKLEGKTLGCWCKKKGENVSCHGDILVEILNLYKLGRLNELF